MGCLAPWRVDDNAVIKPAKPLFFMGFCEDFGDLVDITWFQPLRVPMMKIAKLLLLFFFTSPVFAADISSCTLEKVEDEKNFCKASFAGSGTFCDMIRNGELKRDCTFMVIRIQRDNAYKVKPYVKEVVATE